MTNTLTAALVRPARLYRTLETAEYGALYTEHWDKLVRYMQRYTTSWEVSEELAQETLLNLWRRREKVPVEYPLNVVLWREAFQVRAAWYKQHARRHTIDIEQLWSYSRDDVVHYDTHLDRTVVDALKKVTEKQREALVLCYLFDLEESEVARRLGVTREVVARRKQMGAANLRRILEAQERGQSLERTKCKQGHSIAEWGFTDSNGHTACRFCRRVAGREHARRRRAAAKAAAAN